jgi:beta-lactam-binding protein with PASTA domain
VLANVTGRCSVPNVKGRALPFARTSITFAGCSVGKVRRAYSPNVYAGLVLSEAPTPRTVLSSRGRVNLIVSAGRRP